MVGGSVGCVIERRGGLVLVLAFMTVCGGDIDTWPCWGGVGWAIDVGSPSHMLTCCGIWAGVVVVVVVDGPCRVCWVLWAELLFFGVRTNVQG